MTQKLVADAIRFSPDERPYVAQWLLEIYIGKWDKFQQDAKRIIEAFPDLVEIGYYDNVTSKRGKRAREYTSEIEQLALQLGLRAPWGARETHHLIFKGAITNEFRPTFPGFRFGEPEGFEIVIKRLVEYPQEWTQVRKTILAEARKQYEDGRQKHSWGTPPQKRTSPTLSRQVHWLFEHITLGKSLEKITSDSQLEDQQKYKRNKKHDRSVEYADVKKAVANVAKLIGIKLN